MDEKKIEELAERLVELIDPWDREYATVEDLVNDIKNDPLSVIEYLADRLEEALA